MKRFLILIFVLPSVLIAQKYSVRDGDATNPIVWNIPTPEWCTTGTIQIFTQVTFNCSTVEPAQGKTIEVMSPGKLIVNGDLELGDKRILLVHENGNVVINGDLILTSPGLLTMEAGSNVTVTGDVIMNGINSLAIEMQNDSKLQVLGNFLSSNGITEMGENAELLVIGSITLSGSNRLALSSELGSNIVANNLTLGGDAKMEINGGNLYLSGNLDIHGGGSLLTINQMSNVTIEGSASLTGGDLLVSESIVYINGGLTVDNGDSNVRFNLSSEIHVSGGLDIVDGAVDINGSDMYLIGDLNIIGGDRILRINSDGINDGSLEVIGDVVLMDNALLEVISGTLLIKSLQEFDINNDPLYSGGNLLLVKDKNKGNAKVVVYNDSRIIILGNKEFGVEVGAEDVQGDLLIESGTLEIKETFGQVLIYNNVYSNPDNFFTNWTPTGNEDVPFFVIMGGSTCANWSGPTGSCDDGNAALPVQLISLSANEINGAVDITWKTATELKNDYFTIERSFDGLEYIEIGREDGNGTSTENQDYRYTDGNPRPGMNYYRLVQTDFDGTSEIFGPVSVVVGLDAQSMTVYPNPLDNGSLKLQVVGLKANKAAFLQIIDLNGRAVYAEEIEISREGGEVIELDVASRLQKGIYIVNLIQDQNTFTQRLVKL